MDSRIKVVQEEVTVYQPSIKEMQTKYSISDLLTNKHNGKYSTLEEAEMALKVYETTKVVALGDIAELGLQDIKLVYTEVPIEAMGNHYNIVNGLGYFYADNDYDKKTTGWFLIADQIVGMEDTNYGDYDDKTIRVVLKPEELKARMETYVNNITNIINEHTNRTIEQAVVPGTDVQGHSN